MNEKKNNNTFLNRFSISGIKGLIGIAVVVILAFLIGGLFSGGSTPDTHNEAEHSAQAASKPTIWTCSMHPQIKLPKEGKCPICFMNLIPLESSSDDDDNPRQLKMSETAKQLAQIRTTPARFADAQVEVRMVGKIGYDETRLSYITAWVPGRLDHLYADFTGVTVKKGERIVSIYSPELLAAQEELLQAKVLVKNLNKSSSTILTATAKATLEAAREKLRLVGLTESQVDELESSGQVSEHLTIYAPVGGVVIKKDAQEGMYVKTGTPIYTIADLSKLWVIFEAYESDLHWLKIGQQVEFKVSAIPGESFTAVISFIDPMINPKTRSVGVRAVVNNSRQLLKPEMFVRGIVKSNQLQRENSNEKSLLIPATAPLITGKRAIVYVELPNDEGPLFEGREVELGPRSGDFYVVKSGIQEGDLVVTNGAFKLDSEMQIHAKPSMMSPDGGIPALIHKHGESSSEGMQMQTTNKLKESSNAIHALTPIYQAYFDLQMSLADDDLNSAKNFATEIKKKTGDVDMSLFSQSGHKHWMEFSSKLMNFTDKISNSENIETSRKGFYEISKTIINLHKIFGHTDDRNYFLTFCPMANNNKGAYWLQTVDTVYNSFYGASMLRCGEIKDKYEPTKSESTTSSAVSKNNLTKVYHSYFDLQRSLTFKNLNKIKTAYNSFNDAVTSNKKLGKEVEIAEVLIMSSENGSQATDLKSARSSFLDIANYIIELHDKYGHQEDKNYYLIYCPHATDTAGVSWIQDVDTMYNSFMGGVMPTCSEEKITLLPKNKQ